MAPGPVTECLAKARGVDQADVLADRPRLLDGVGPPAAAAEAARGVVVEALRRVVVRALPAVDLAELRAARLHPVVAGGGAQRPAGLALLVGVVQDEDVGVALLVLARGVLGGHPGAEALGVERGHVDLGLARGHHLREVVAGAAGGGDAEGEALGEPEVAQARRRADQRVAVGGVADRAVEVVLEARRSRTTGCGGSSTGTPPRSARGRAGRGRRGSCRGRRTRSGRGRPSRRGRGSSRRAPRGRTTSRRRRAAPGARGWPGGRRRARGRAR